MSTLPPPLPGTEFRALRERLNLTQQALGALLGVNSETLRRQESRAWTDPLYTLALLKVADVLAPPPVARSPGRPPVDPTAAAVRYVEKQAHVKRLRAILKRNELRDRERPIIAQIVADLLPFAQSRNLDGYREALARWRADDRAGGEHARAFLDASEDKLILADDPLVTLPPEPLA